MQVNAFLPQMTSEVLKYAEEHHQERVGGMKRNTSLKSVEQEIHKKKQFSTLNCVPYHRELHSKLTQGNQLAHS